MAKTKKGIQLPPGHTIKLFCRSNNCVEEQCPFRNETEFGTICAIREKLFWKDGDHCKTIIEVRITPGW